MIGARVDLYIRRSSTVHRLDPRAKMVALAGFLVAAWAAPVDTFWPTVALMLLALGTTLLARVPLRAMGARLLPVATAIGIPFALSRLGGAQTQTAANVFAVRSLLTAVGFLVFAATTPVSASLEVLGRVPGLAYFTALAEFIVRGTGILTDEVTRTLRAWSLRAPACRTWRRLGGLLWMSVSLVGRAAARSERVGAAMVLRGYDGRFQSFPGERLPRRHLAVGIAHALCSLLVLGAARWP